MARKTKFQEMLEKTKEKLKAQEESSGGGFNKNREYTPNFYPNKLLKTSEKVRVRILPIKDDDKFYITYPGHSFSVGGNYFNLICGEAESNKGEKFGDCPICGFLKDNNGDIEKKVYGTLMARDKHLCYVFNYDTERIEKYEFDNGILSQIVEALIEADFDDDSDGFDVIFIKNPENNWLSIKEVKDPKKELNDLLEDYEIETIPDIVDKEMVWSPSYILKRLRDSGNLAVRALIPEYEDLDMSAFSKSSNETKSDTKKKSKKQEDVFDDEDDINEEVFDEEDDKPKKSTKSSKSSKPNKNNKDDEDLDEFDAMFDEDSDNEEEIPF